MFYMYQQTFCKVAKLLEDSKHTKRPLDSNNKLNENAIGPCVAHLRGRGKALSHQTFCYGYLMDQQVLRDFTSIKNIK